jgi:hypothetical protein
MRSLHENQNTDIFRDMPLSIVWSVWLAKNSSLFYDRFIPLSQWNTQIISIIKRFNLSKVEKPHI